MVCCGWRWCLGEVSNYATTPTRGGVCRQRLVSRQRARAWICRAYSRGQLPPSPRLEIQVPDLGTVQTKPANQTPQSDHGLVWVASPLNGSRLSSISQQLIRQEQPSIEAQQSITNKAGWRSLYHGKAAGIFVKERPSQQRGSKHGATRTTVPAGLFEMFESLPPLNKAREWCHRKFVPAFHQRNPRHSEATVGEGLLSPPPAQEGHEKKPST